MAYQLAELKTIVQAGFSRNDAAHETMAEQIVSQRVNIAKHGERIAALEKDGGWPVWLKGVAALATVAGAAVAGHV